MYRTKQKKKQRWDLSLQIRSNFHIIKYTFINVVISLKRNKSSRRRVLCFNQNVERKTNYPYKYSISFHYKKKHHVQFKDCIVMAQFTRKYGSHGACMRNWPIKIELSSVGFQRCNKRVSNWWKYLHCDAWKSSYLKVLRWPE